jgi:hypothetical protein
MNRLAEKSAVVPECVCDSFRNNKLHWALISYINGFTWPHCYYYCELCTRNKISWRNDEADYKATLIPEATIVKMMIAEPDLVLGKNLFGKPPFMIIPMLVDLLMGVMENPYKHIAECGRAHENLLILLTIQKKIHAILEKN